MILTNKKALTSLVVIIFIVTNLCFIFLQIHKQSQFVKLSYTRQRLEKERAELEKKRDELTHQLYIQQSSKTVKKYASDKLGMRDTNVAQIHKIEQ